MEREIGERGRERFEGEGERVPMGERGEKDRARERGRERGKERGGRERQERLSDIDLPVNEGGR